jgi:general secretion pathway protein G
MICYALLPSVTLKYLELLMITTSTDPKNKANGKRFQAFALSAIVVAVALGYFGLYKPKQEQEIGAARLREVNKALDLFYQDCKSFPKADAGLTSLIEKPEDCKDWQGPYLERGLLNDAWGRPYIYAREEEYYSLKTLGADGEPGGDGANQDLPE